MLLLYWVIFVSLLTGCSVEDPLPSWNDGDAKKAILEFVRQTTDPKSPHFVPEGDRIATFDQDGTLWVEHPLYAQGIFALDRIKQLAPEHPEWKSKEPFQAILTNNEKAVEKFTNKDWQQIIASSHTGITTDVFSAVVKQWLDTAKHPRYQRPFTELIYQPMLEVMNLLRKHSYKTFIVTGGGQAFVRVYAQNVYQVPTENVVGSSIETKYEYEKGKPVLMTLPKIFLIDDHTGKAIGIHLFIGKRPFAAFGNSDGDREMLEWTQAGEGARLMMLVHHDDPVREYAYGPAGGLPDTHVGRFSDELMSEAKDNKWIVISMKNDWKRIFSFEPPR